MKKVLSYLLLLIMFALQLFGCANISSKNSKEEVRLIAFDWLDSQSKQSIRGVEEVKVEEVTFDDQYFIATESNVIEPSEIDIKDRATYKVTFNTVEDEMLGPIVVYLDKNKLEVLGIDFRG